MSVRFQHTLLQFKKVLRYDNLTGKFYWLKSRNGILIGEEAGYRDIEGYIRICVNGISYKAHRLVWLFETGEWPKLHIDHINRTKNDNRFINLRDVTRSENIKNSKLRKDI
jgi:hypothetical protein